MLVAGSCPPSPVVSVVACTPDLPVLYGTLPRSAAALLGFPIVTVFVRRNPWVGDTRGFHGANLLRRPGVAVQTACSEC